MPSVSWQKGPDKGQSWREWREYSRDRESASYFKPRQRSRGYLEDESASNVVEYVMSYGLPWAWLQDYLKKRFPGVDTERVRSDNVSAPNLPIVLRAPDHLPPELTIRSRFAGSHERQLCPGPPWGAEFRRCGGG
jgi:hypothetical protein